MTIRRGVRTANCLGFVGAGEAVGDKVIRLGGGAPDLFSPGQKNTFNPQFI